MHLLSLLRKRTFVWKIWGTEVSMTIPRNVEDIRVDLPTKNEKPGQESLNFYDIAYRSDTGNQISVGEPSLNDPIVLSNDELRALDTDKKLLLCLRYRFSRTWLVKIKNEECSLLADGIVYRNAQYGSMYQPDNLKKAHLKLLSLEYSRQNEGYQKSLDNDDGFYQMNQEPDISALNWRTKNIGGYVWQGYDVFDARGKREEQWLFPLGDDHYLGLRIAVITPYTRYYEFIKKFDRFSRKLLKSVSLTVQDPKQLLPIYSPELELSHTISELDIDPSILGYREHLLESWYRLNSNESSNDRIDDMPRISSPYRPWVFVTQSVVLLLLAFTAPIILIFAGFEDYFVWLEKLPIPYSDWIPSIAFILFVIQQKLGKKILKMKEQS